MMMIRAPKRRRRRCDASVPLLSLSLLLPETLLRCSREGGRVKTSFPLISGWNILSSDRGGFLEDRLDPSLFTSLRGGDGDGLVTRNLIPIQHCPPSESPSENLTRRAMAMASGSRPWPPPRPPSASSSLADDGAAAAASVVSHRRTFSVTGSDGGRKDGNKSADKENDFAPSDRSTISSSGFGVTSLVPLIAFIAYGCSEPITYPF